MKQIFDWLREQIQTTANVKKCPSEGCWERTSKNCNKCDLKSLEVRDIFEVINEAEAKWEAEVCEWKFFKFSNSLYENHGDFRTDVELEKWIFCPYCGKPIKISEVE